MGIQMSPSERASPRTWTSLPAFFSVIPCQPTVDKPGKVHYFALPSHHFGGWTGNETTSSRTCWGFALSGHPARLRYGNAPIRREQ